MRTTFQTSISSRKTGIAVVMLGPDGCGKSSVAKRLIEDIGCLFTETYYAHWKPRMFRRQENAKAIVVNPHDQLPRGPIVSTFYFAFHWLQFVIAGWYQFRVVRRRNHLLVIDRYYYDFFVDLGRYRLDVPKRLVTVAGWFVPVPDLVICLDAPARTIQKRKQEVPLAESERQCAAYRLVVGTFPNAHLIDSSRSLNEVVEEVRGLVTNKLGSTVTRR